MKVNLNDLIAIGGDEWVSAEYILQNFDEYNIAYKNKLNRITDKYNIIHIKIGNTKLYSLSNLELILNYITYIK